MTELRSNLNEFYSEMDLVEIIYVETLQELWAAAAINVNHHLKKLTKEDILEEHVSHGKAVWKIKSISKF